MFINVGSNEVCAHWQDEIDGPIEVTERPRKVSNFFVIYRKLNIFRVRTHTHTCPVLYIHCLLQVMWPSKI